MSGYRRHIMARLATRSTSPYIEGYAFDVDGVYPAQVSIRYNGAYHTITVNQDTGYFREDVELTSLQYCLQDNKTVRIIRVYAPNVSLHMGSFARRSNVEEIDLSGIVATDLYIAFGISASDYSSGYRCKTISLKVPIITNATTVSGTFANATLLTAVAATYIEQTFDIRNSPLTLQSAINILNALQDVTAYGGKTLYFSSTTKGYINNDATALALVANAVNNLGWTIALN